MNDRMIRSIGAIGASAVVAIGAEDDLVRLIGVEAGEVEAAVRIGYGGDVVVPDIPGQVDLAVEDVERIAGRGCGAGRGVGGGCGCPGDYTECHAGVGAGGVILQQARLAQ